MSSIKKGKCINLDWFKSGKITTLKKCSNYQILKSFNKNVVYLLYIDRLNTYIICEIDNTNDVKEATKIFNDEYLKEIIKNRFEVI